MKLALLVFLPVIGRIVVLWGNP